MTRAGIEVEGAAQLRRTLKAAGDDLGDLKAAHRAAAAVVAGAAARAAPKRTGRLAGNIRPAGTKTAAIIRSGSAAVPYANPIHWGWPAHNIAAALYISGPAKQTESTWVALYQTEVKRIIGKVKGA